MDPSNTTICLIKLLFIVECLCCSGEHQVMKFIESSYCLSLNGLFRRTPNREAYSGDLFYENRMNRHLSVVALMFLQVRFFFLYLAYFKI